MILPALSQDRLKDSFGQNFGARISFKQEAFQYSPTPDSDRQAATARATASMSAESG
jgi:hypothetical protein